jgi:hypothetical protein
MDGQGEAARDLGAAESCVAERAGVLDLRVSRFRGVMSLARARKTDADVSRADLNAFRASPELATKLGGGQRAGAGPQGAIFGARPETASAKSVPEFLRFVFHAVAGAVEDGGNVGRGRPGAHHRNQGRDIVLRPEAVEARAHGRKSIVHLGVP